MAYEAEQIAVDGISIMQLDKMEIHCAPGGHGRCRLSGYVAADSGEAVIYGMQENLPLKVSAGGSLIFSGLVTYARVSGMGGTYYVEAEGRTRSILMDQEQHSRSFQDVNMTYKQLVKAILSEYPEAEVSYSIPDVPIKEIAVQYRETDWQFLKRMLSMLHAPLACNPAGETIQLYAGVPEIPYRDWGYEITGFRKEMGEFQYWQQSGMGRGDDCFQVAELQTGCMAGLYESLKVFGQRLSVRGISGKLEKGAFRCRCELQKAEGILARTEYPMHLVGSALKGKVLAASGSRIQVHLQIDDGNGQPDVHWFPFSTLSASQDGSGWYYMPEQGDQVRVYFPTKHTKDAMAVSAVSSYDGKADSVPDRMGSPSTKYLRNPSGQELKMGEDGVTISCSGGSASITMGNNGDVLIHAADTLLVQASNNVELCAETEIALSAAQAAVVSCAKGGCVQMQKEGKLLVQGTEVKID
ncbi:contractile injection system protein, VgrG/Pvc8 family [uncultured Acetatifactor sp.]|uniref:contractile injection system protein, VgrG/Pvc8 family n=1 Tax=uncultured Acetatifactor sp. TaxID=1671927 RepID=UPI0026F38617|nr:contractile injection system protein, VgrG/Pvc8 family [uncultured Acetatifactor sp.]